MDYIFKNGKYIFDKNGVYFALTEDQVKDMRNTCEDILGETLDEEAARAIDNAKLKQGW